MTPARRRQEIPAAGLPQLPCLCGNLRRAARLVSQLYESECGWTADLSVAQLSLLQAIAERGTITHASLGCVLGLDQTTVSRSIAALSSRGWVSMAPGKDRRERFISLSREGRNKLRQMKRVWRRAQEKLRRLYGADECRRLERMLTALAAIVQSG